MLQSLPFCSVTYSSRPRWDEKDIAGFWVFATPRKTKGKSLTQRPRRTTPRELHTSFQDCFRLVENVSAECSPALGLEVAEQGLKQGWTGSFFSLCLFFFLFSVRCGELAVHCYIRIIPDGFVGPLGSAVLWWG